MDIESKINLDQEVKSDDLVNNLKTLADLNAIEIAKIKSENHLLIQNLERFDSESNLYT